MKRRGIMAYLTTIVIAALCLAFVPITASAIQTEYFTVANANLGVSGPYGEVTWDVDSGTRVDFNVLAYADVLNQGGNTNFGIDKFGFNTNFTLTESQFHLPDGWTVDSLGNTMDGFGFFEIATAGPGSRVNPLVFNITGLTGATDADFYILSTGIADNGYGHFAMHVGGFSPELNGYNSAYFRDGSSSVPDADIMLLLGTALIFLGILQKKRVRV